MAGVQDESALQRMSALADRGISRRPPGRSIFLLLVVALALAASVAASIFPLGTREGYFLGDRVDHALDGTGSLTAEALRGDAGHLLMPADGRLVNHGTRGGRNALLWLRIKVPNLSGEPDAPWTISLQETRAREVRLYVPGPDGRDVEFQYRVGERNPQSGLVPRFASFTFERAEIEGKTLLMSIFTRSSKRALLWIEPREVFVSGELRQTLLFGVLFGVLAGLFCYLLSLGAMLRDGALITLAVFIGLFSAYVIADRAFLESFLFPGAVGPSRVVSIAASQGCYGAWVAFLIIYLRTATHSRLLTGLGLAISVVGFVMMVLTGIEAAYDTAFLRPIVPYFGIAALCSGFLIAALSFRKERQRVVAFLACWSPAMLAAIMRLMLDASPAVASGTGAVFSVYVAVVFSMLCFAIILSLDIQEREYRLRRAAEIQEERFRSFARSASDGFWETDRYGRLLSMTGPMTAFRLDQGVDLAASLRLTAPQHHPAIDGLDAAMKQMRPFRGIELMVAPGSQQKILAVELSGEPFEREGIFAGYRGIVRDLTERRRQQDHEIRQQRIAAIGQMASGMAHEINNLLHPIINLSRRVRDTLRSDDAGRKYLEIVLASGDKARSILADLLASVHPASARKEQKPFIEALRDASAEIRVLVSPQVNLELDIQGLGGPPVLQLDMSLVISNLIANAVFASRQAGTVKIIGSLAMDQSLATLSVIDEGSGMSRDVAAKALEPFFTTKPIGSGTGLGLSTVAGIVKRWGGKIMIESTPHMGTTITITVPLAANSTAPEADTAPVMERSQNKELQ